MRLALARELRLVRPALVVTVRLEVLVWLEEWLVELVWLDLAVLGLVALRRSRTLRG